MVYVIYGGCESEFEWTNYYMRGVYSNFGKAFNKLKEIYDEIVTDFENCVNSEDIVSNFEQPAEDYAWFEITYGDGNRVYYEVVGTEIDN